MSSSGSSFWNNRDARLNSPNRMTTLNPNAAEFVPSALRSLPGNKKRVDVTRLQVPGTSGKAVLDQSLSSTDNSDDDAHQYWHHQLPDDITPDFKGTGEELQATGGQSLARLSMNDGIEKSGFPRTVGSHRWGLHHEISPQRGEYKNLNKRMAYSGLPYPEDDSSTAFVSLNTNPLDRQFTNGDQHLTNNREHHYGGNSRAGFLNGLVSEHAVLGNPTANPVEFLASRFPAFTVESIRELYYENGRDMNLTIEMLSQPQLKVDNGLNQKMNSKALPASSLELDFPALTLPDSQDKLLKYSGEELQQATNAFQQIDDDVFCFNSIPSNESMGTPDLISAVQRLASREFDHWKYERSGTADASSGPTISSQLLTSSHGGHGKTALADKLRGLGASLAASSWLETGEATAQVYSVIRDEGHDVAHFQNSCLEQAKQAYIIGNKAFARELSAKGQLYNIQMKEAHEKARELINRQRNPVTQLQSYNQAHMIDLQGLHVNEAIHVLKHELNILRRTARSAGRRLQVMICMSTGLHTRGSRNPVRLPIAIQQCLLDENLQFSEDQPGILRVVIC